MRSYGFLALAFACTFSNAAWAADCKPLNIVSILDMTPIDRGGRVTVPISLNGTEKNFLVDTGGVYPQVTAQVAEELKLPQHHSPVEFYSEDGSLSRTAALVHVHHGQVAGVRHEFADFAGRHGNHVSGRLPELTISK